MGDRNVIQVFSKSQWCAWVVAIAAFACLAGILAPGTNAAVTVGTDLNLSVDAWNSGAVFTQKRNLDASGSIYHGFAVYGVLTSISVKTQGDAATLRAYLLRQSGAPSGFGQEFLNASTIISIAVPNVPAPEGAITSVGTRIGVKLGDRLGLAGPIYTRFLHVPTGLSGLDYCYFGDTPHHPQTLLTYESEFCNNHMPMVSGIVEPDLDRDGYGDETQDACPTDGTRFDRACASSNLTITAKSAKPTSRFRATITYRITNNGELSSDDVRFTSNLSRKLRSQTIVDGCKPRRDRRSCTIASLAPGDVKTIRVRVTGKRRGTVSINARVSGATRESTREDNYATSRVRLKR